LLGWNRWGFEGLAKEIPAPPSDHIPLGGACFGIDFAQAAVNFMPESFCRPEPSLIPIKPPHCPKCHGRMMLARIEHNPGGYAVRVFDCPQCEHVQKLLIE
jgi:hypothetical protein